MIGVQTHFIRLAYCDFKCSWCDSMHAVDPKQARANSTMMTPTQVVEKLKELPGAVSWVTLSGGNPVMHDCTELIEALHEAGFKVALETQGSLWKPWVEMCNSVTISPKPPSSLQPTNYEVLAQYFEAADELYINDFNIKVVAFDEPDLEYVERLVGRFGRKFNWFISVGTRPEDTRESLCERWRAISESVLKYHITLSDVRILCQAHVLLWGHKQGV